ncbi:hypothetical protein [Halomonas xianhensis]|uniref:DnaK suppressor protein n=1 Tax=Modicisalibacter xianhensis TaxID=442341 RepID=A0A1I3DPB8_9GAMM|nr:DnaK suppressor protein [Halomonas xianhensis]
MEPAEEARLLAMSDDAYMNEEQLAFFRCRLLTGKTRIASYLLLRPTATLCLEAKERQEQREHHYRKLRGES